MLRLLIDSLASRLPSQCRVCKAWPAQPVCEACVARFAQPVPRCRTCALPLPISAGSAQCGKCIRQAPPLDACIAAVTYGYPWSLCLAGFKFNGEPGWASALARLLRSTPWAEPALEASALVLPMPMSRERLRERGYNQALELARRLAPAKTDGSLLLRIRHALPQVALPRAERIRNVQGAFAVDPLRAHLLRGARVVLVDDVMTSGASLFAAAAALRQAGACHVTGMVLARTAD